LLREFLDALASLWNELTCERRQNYFAEDDSSVWGTEDYRKRYVSVLGSAAAQQVIRKNDEAWRSFFKLKEDPETRHKAHPPGYWGNEDEGRILRSYVRNDSYSLRWSDPSTIEFTVGKDLKSKYGLGRSRPTFDVHGRPKWEGKQGRLELYYDETDDTYRAIQPVRDCSQRDTPLADHTAALDVGANNLVACTTTNGRQYLYTGRDLFDRFRETTLHIGELQSEL
jgi:putative transposase